MRVSLGRSAGLQNRTATDRHCPPAPRCSVSEQANAPDCKPGYARGGTETELHVVVVMFWEHGGL